MISIGVQQLMTHRAHPPLRVSVRPRRPHRRPQDPHAFRGEDGVEGVSELRIPIANQEPKPVDAVCQVYEQIAGLLSYPQPGRIGRYPENVDPAGGKLDHEQHVQALEQDRVDVEEVGGQDPFSLRGQKLPPTRPSTARPGQCLPG